MRTIISLILLGVVVTSMISCAAALGGAMLNTSKSVSGKAVDLDKISQLERGFTTSAQVVTLFGQPTTITAAGPNDLYVYKQCQQGSTGVGGGVLGIGKKVGGLGAVGVENTKQKCNELTVIIDRTTDKVVDYSYLKEFGK